MKRESGHVSLETGIFPILVLALLITGCGRPRLPSPPANLGPASSTWSRLVSAHFRMSTDANPTRAREMLMAFETTYHAFADVLFPSKEASPPIDIILFDAKNEFEEIALPSSGGFFRTRGPLDVEEHPTIVMFGSLDGQTRMAFQHELTHRFVRRALGPLPPWLNEGLAEYYSTVRIEHDSMFIGDYALDEHPSVLPTLGELLGADRSAFYAGFDGTLAGRIRGRSYYIGAWNLVHLLMNGPASYRARFNSVLGHVEKGESVATAWAHAFPTEERPALEAAYRDYLRKPVKTVRATRFDPPISSLDDWRAMADAEVNLLWARLDPLRKDHGRRAREHIANAKALAPSWIEAWIALGMLEEETGEYAEAGSDLEAAVRAAPSDPVALLALAQFNWHREKRLPSAARNYERYLALMNRLGAVAVTSDELDMVAWYHALRRQPELGLPYAKRAMALDPTSPDVLDTFAVLLFQSGDRENALTTAERAVNLTSERVGSSEIAEHLVRMRAALAGADPLTVEIDP